MSQWCRGGADGVRGTHVSNVEAFVGITVAILRPLVARRWNRLFQAAVDGLVHSAAAERTATSG